MLGIPKARFISYTGLQRLGRRKQQAVISLPGQEDAFPPVNQHSPLEIFSTPS